MLCYDYDGDGDYDYDGYVMNPLCPRCFIFGEKLNIKMHTFYRTVSPLHVKMHTLKGRRF